LIDSPQARLDSLRALAAECHARGDVEGAILALHRALVVRRDDLACQQLLCRLLYENPSAFVPDSPVSPASTARAPELVSVVVCSIDPAKFDRVRASYARAFGSAPWEVVGIHDARSLAEGYRRGVDRSRGEMIVFSHDDIDILTGNLGGELAHALDELDVVGIVGTTKLVGPAFAWGGKVHTRGRIAEPVPDGGVQLVVYNPAPGVTGGLQAIDGVFLAARRETIVATGFDAETFDGFHLYDIDFSYRAHLSGKRVGVTSGIVLRHDSGGNFDATWEDYARRFLAKFPSLTGERVQNFMSRVPFADADSLMQFCHRFDTAGRRASLDAPP
jgi:hypothetical protein